MDYDTYQRYHNRHTRKMSLVFFAAMDRELAEAARIIGNESALAFANLFYPDPPNMHNSVILGKHVKSRVFASNQMKHILYDIFGEKNGTIRNHMVQVNNRPLSVLSIQSFPTRLPLHRTFDHFGQDVSFEFRDGAVMMERRDSAVLDALPARPFVVTMNAATEPSRLTIETDDLCCEIAGQQLPIDRFVYKDGDKYRIVKRNGPGWFDIDNPARNIDNDTIKRYATNMVIFTFDTNRDSIQRCNPAFLYADKMLGDAHRLEGIGGLELFALVALNDRTQQIATRGYTKIYQEFIATPESITKEPNATLLSICLLALINKSMKAALDIVTNPAKRIKRQVFCKFNGNLVYTDLSNIVPEAFKLFK